MHTISPQTHPLPGEYPKSWGKTFWTHFVNFGHKGPKGAEMWPISITTCKSNGSPTAAKKWAFLRKKKPFLWSGRSSYALHINIPLQSDFIQNTVSDVIGWISISISPYASHHNSGLYCRWDVFPKTRDTTGGICPICSLTAAPPSLLYQSPTIDHSLTDAFKDFMQGLWGALDCKSCTFTLAED